MKYSTTSVANEGLVLYIGRDYGLHLNIVLLVQYVSRRVVMVSSWGDVRRRTIRVGRKPSDWCRAPEISAAAGHLVEWGAAAAGESVSSWTLNENSPVVGQKSVFLGIYNMLCLFLVEGTLLIIFQPGDILSPLGKFVYCIN